MINKSAIRRVLLGMSGGTDSSVAALFLLEQGYEVVGVTFRFFEHEGDQTHLNDARELAARLGIRHLTVDARKEFEEVVIGYFVSEYMEGRTPSPCVLCNNHFKFRLLDEVAEHEQCDLIATGHYVRIVSNDDRFYVVPGIDPDKDQSFFLWGLSQATLRKVLFPLGGWTKSAVRAYAAEQGFDRVATKRDSIGVCFCPDDYRAFLEQRVGKGAIGRGDFVDVNGHFIAHHRGYPFYTVGQRRGLGINLPRPVFVRHISSKSNTVVLAHDENMYQSSFRLKEVYVHSYADFPSDNSLICKIRYRKQATRCRVEFCDNRRAIVHLADPLNAIAPGQTAVFYHEERVVGGGWIE